MVGCCFIPRARYTELRMFWRLLPQALNGIYAARRFGIAGAFRLAFEVCKVKISARQVAAFFLTVYLSILTSVCCAVQVGGVDFPTQWKIDDQVLALNGAGVREYGFFRIPVYAAAMYLVKLESNPNVLQAQLGRDGPIVVHLQMLRDVSQSDSVKGWQVYINANCQSACRIEAEARAQFYASIPEAKKNDTQTYVFMAGKLNIYRNDTKVASISNRELIAAILASWIGSEPTTEALKRSLLGLVRIGG
jgi:Chalcone isomerase-like